MGASTVQSELLAIGVYETDRYHIIVGLSPADSPWHEMYRDNPRTPRLSFGVTKVALKPIGYYPAFLPYGKPSEGPQGGFPTIIAASGGASLPLDIKCGVRSTINHIRRLNASKHLKLCDQIWTAQQILVQRSSRSKCPRYSLILVR